MLKFEVHLFSVLKRYCLILLRNVRFVTARRAHMCVSTVGAERVGTCSDTPQVQVQGKQLLLLQQDAGGRAVPRELPAPRAARHRAAHRSGAHPRCSAQLGAQQMHVIRRAARTCKTFKSY